MKKKFAKLYNLTGVLKFEISGAVSKIFEEN